MKVAFDAKRVFHNFTGLGNYSRTLIESLALHFPEHDYLLYTPPYHDERGEDWLTKMNQLKVIQPETLPGKVFPSMWRSLCLSRVLRKNPPDLYHGLSHELPSRIHKTSIKTVVTVHDLIFMRYPKQYSAIDSIIYKKKLQYSCQVADLVVAICEQTKRDLIDFLKVPKDKIRVVYQSCDPLFYQQKTAEDKEAVRVKYVLPRKFMLYVGSFTERKNLLNLVHGLSYSQRVNDIPLVLVGRGPKNYRNEIFSLACKLGVQNNLIFLECVPLEDLPALYQQALLFVYPSLFEGFGIPILEAFFSNTPVLTSTGSCFHETGGDAAIYANPENPEEIGAAMARIIENQALRQVMIEKGRIWAQQFHFQNTAKNMMETYKMLIS